VPDTNFVIAPPPRDVDGLHAVPIDIQRISARLTFDGATQTSAGDATVDFTMGVEDGCPVFDLRQTITGVWLDGNPVPVSSVSLHDFGGGTGAELRILQQVLSAGSAHSLRLTYSLGVPQASMAGSYLPALSWSAGPALRLSFGFTDLGPGRYLDAWVPANLIFDQYEVLLDLKLLNTSVAHSLITNGTVTNPGAGHWSVSFPSRVTAFSTMLELRESSTLATQAQNVTLPDGTAVTIEAWKLTAGTTDLAAEITALSGFLATNTNAYGPYMHGARFVVFFITGGMEYDGGTTATTGTLKHETHHSWWGRGVKPASQNDGWLDEAWTVFVTDGLTPLPFNAADPPVQLCSQNPWTRATPIESYTAGARLFQGLASAAGDAQLRSAMASFYKNRPARPITTLEIEGHLLSQTGRPEIVDAFHRWVYGFSSPTGAPDLWLRDDPAHTGAELWTGRFWQSPDLWIRNQDDGGVVHQNPIAGRDNWFYARVRNRGTASPGHFMVTFVVKEFAGTEFVYPEDFLPATAASGGFDLAPNATAIVKARWPAAQVPAAGTHGCLLASVHALGNHPVGGRHVWEENALAQLNLTIVPALAAGFVAVKVMIGHFKLRERAVLLEIRRPKGFPDMRASLELLQQRPLPVLDEGRVSALDCARDAPAIGPALPVVVKELIIPPGETARVEVGSPAGFPLLAALRLEVPKAAKPGQSLLTDLVQLDPAGHPTGGIAVLTVVKGSA
jgi:hypothetical protein